MAGNTPICQFFNPILVTSCNRRFPSGHASGGYGQPGLYLFIYHYKPKWRWEGLSIGMLVGLTFGIAQQLRGTHFLSHDIWSLAICWFSALIVYWLTFSRQRYNRNNV